MWRPRFEFRDDGAGNGKSGFAIWVEGIEAVARRMQNLDTVVRGHRCYVQQVTKTDNTPSKLMGKMVRVDLL